MARYVYTFSRHGTNGSSVHDSLVEAVKSMRGDVEYNEAAPISITGPSPILTDDKRVRFDTKQCYVLAALYEEARSDLLADIQ